MILRNRRLLESLTSRNEYHVILIWCRCNFFQFCFSCITDTDCKDSDTLVAKWLRRCWYLTAILWTSICDKDQNLWNFLAPSSICFDVSRENKSLKWTVIVKWPFTFVGPVKRYYLRAAPVWVSPCSYGIASILALRSSAPLIGSPSSISWWSWTVEE